MTDPTTALAAAPTVYEWLDHAQHGLQSLSDLYHGGGADGKGITVKEFRDGIDFVWEQINNALAALSGYTLMEVEESLDAAWKAAEAALPEGWIFEVGNWQAEPHRPPDLYKYEATAEPYNYREAETRRLIGHGSTPAEALRNLAAALTAESSNAK